MAWRRPNILMQWKELLNIPILIFIFFISKHQRVNSWWPSDPKWRQASWSTLVQVMTCHLTAPSHYLSQSWVTLSEVFWYSPKTISQEILKISLLDMSLIVNKITTASPRDHELMWERRLIMDGQLVGHMEDDDNVCSTHNSKGCLTKRK